MEQKLNQCPKDKTLEYYRDHCRNVLRKSPLRSWCRQCELFSEDTDTDPSPT